MYQSFCQKQDPCSAFSVAESWCVFGGRTRATGAPRTPEHKSMIFSSKIAVNLSSNFFRFINFSYHFVQNVFISCHFPSLFPSRPVPPTHPPSHEKHANKIWVVRTKPTKISSKISPSLSLVATPRHKKKGGNLCIIQQYAYTSLLPSFSLSGYNQTQRSSCLMYTKKSTTACRLPVAGCTMCARWVQKKKGRHARKTKHAVD